VTAQAIYHRKRSREQQALAALWRTRAELAHARHEERMRKMDDDHEATMRLIAETGARSRAIGMRYVWLCAINAAIALVDMFALPCSSWSLDGVAVAAIGAQAAMHANLLHWRRTDEVLQILVHS